MIGLNLALTKDPEHYVVQNDSSAEFAAISNVANTVNGWNYSTDEEENKKYQ